MEKEKIIEILKKEKGRSLELAEAVIQYMKTTWQSREKNYAALEELLLAGNPKDLSAVFENGPRRLFFAVHGNEVAARSAKAVARMNRFVHSPSTYRRSFRTEAVGPYMQRFCRFIVDLLFFSWEKYDMLSELTAPAQTDRQEEASFPALFAGDFIALAIDEGDTAIISAIKEICLGENNVKLLSYTIINGILKSGNPQMHKMLGDMLLAAKLQEGLRQSIMENADNGSVEAFLYLMKIVLDNDLLRYSSVLRAVDVWMGLGETFDDKRVASKLLTLAYQYLTDTKAAATALESKDVIEIYTALWAVSVREMADTRKPIEKLLKGDKYRKLVALYFLNQTENDELKFAITSKIIADAETDLDILSLTMWQYPVNAYTPWNVSEFSKMCRQNRFLRDKRVRDAQFEGLLRMLPVVPEKGYSASGKPFPWCSLEITPKRICFQLLNIAGFDFDTEKTKKLMEIMPRADSVSREAFVELYLRKPANQAERGFLFASLSDKSMTVRSRALQNVLDDATGDSKTELSEAEKNQVMDLLSLKTGDIRQNSVKILLAMQEPRPAEAALRLLSDSNENKRLGGLDIMNQMLASGRLAKEKIAEMIACMPKTGDRERVLIAAMTAESPRFCRANGFGLYNPAYRPELPVPAAEKNGMIDSVFGISAQRLHALFDSLCALLKANRDYTFQVENYEGLHDMQLGTLYTPYPRAEAKNGEGTSFDKFVLQDVWHGWMRENGLTFSELFYFMFADEVSDYDDKYNPDYADFAKDLITEMFHAKEVNSLLKFMRNKEYGVLAKNLLGIFWTEFSETERFGVLSKMLQDVMSRLTAEDWLRPVEEDDDDDDRWVYRRKDRRKDTFVDTDEIGFLMRCLENAAKEDEHFTFLTALCFEIGRLSDLFYCALGVTDIARGVNMGILQREALMRPMFLVDGNMVYAGKISREYYRKEAEKYPVLKECADEAAARVIEIELGRGDSETEVSKIAASISWHEGVETFVKILTALGNETFVRGYVYYSSSGSKKDVLSSLLKASHPAEGDNAAALAAALEGKNISEKRLIEAVMYAPAWLDIAAEYLGWPGLVSAAWYFHAHINESFSAEKETEVARYSPVSPEEFNDGAFDIEWFRDAWGTLGEARFAIVYDSAKYLTEGSNHRRAQLFADAVLGKLDKDTLSVEIHEKRNKDKLLAYSLIPLAAEDAGSEAVMSEALKRYEFIEQFLKESKKFGAQRRASEASICGIAKDNLARNAGFSDVLRFTWRMEILKIEEVRACFEAVQRGAYQVCVKIADDGSAALVCEKDGKKLASVPAALKKDEYVLECKEVVTSLKAQYKRARASLEQAMVNRDVFEYGEIKALTEHPVVSPLLEKLVFVSLDKKGGPQKSGMFRELGRMKDDATLRIAHPYDLFVLDTWLDCQRYAFENKLVQPFKQIFRELYLLNEDEKREKTLSRRYAGHQVQSKKTVALLKGRGWTVDYEEGLQRVYYKDNFYATVYAAADWFTPAEIEAPTLEQLQFFPRRVAPGDAYKPLELEKIPPVILSEVMRDLDLVVSVAHVGGVDPEASHSTIEMRAAICRELLALLHVENVTIEERHAKIKGSLGEYTVHLGSAQVHKMGRGAVTILAVPSQHRGRVFLPFADEDPRTAEVMSKILMLADDKTIKDPAILAQIE